MSSLRYLFISFAGDVDPLITQTFEGDTIQVEYSSIHLGIWGENTVKVGGLGDELLESLGAMVSSYAMPFRTYFLIRYGKEGIPSEYISASETTPDVELRSDTTHLSVANFHLERLVDTFRRRIADGFFTNPYSLKVLRYGWIDELVAPSLRCIKLANLALSDVRTIVECTRLEELEITEGLDELDIGSEVYIDLDIDWLKCSSDTFVKLSKFINLARVGRLEIINFSDGDDNEKLRKVSELSRDIPVLELELNVLVSILKELPEFYHPNIELRSKACGPAKSLVAKYGDRVGSITYRASARYSTTCIIGTHVQIFYFNIQNQHLSRHISATNVIHVNVDGGLKKSICKYPRGHVTIDFNPHTDAGSLVE